MANDRQAMQLIAATFDGDAFRQILAWVMEPHDRESRQRRGELAKAAIAGALRDVDGHQLDVILRSLSESAARDSAWLSPATRFTEN
jgi:hypothetical protein